MKTSFVVTSYRATSSLFLLRAGCLQCSSAKKRNSRLCTYRYHRRILTTSPDHFGFTNKGHHRSNSQPPSPEEKACCLAIVRLNFRRGDASIRQVRSKRRITTGSKRTIINDDRPLHGSGSSMSPPFRQSPRPPFNQVHHPPAPPDPPQEPSDFQRLRSRFEGVAPSSRARARAAMDHQQHNQGAIKPQHNQANTPGQNKIKIPHDDC